MTSPRESILELKARMGRDIIGQEAMVERILIGLLANGHLLVESLPGLAKTRAIKSLGRHLDADLSRIQFAPDLLPSHVTGARFRRCIRGAMRIMAAPSKRAS
jgi:MoxR-like ATPase